MEYIMKKKILLLIMSFILALSVLGACSKDKADSADKDAPAEVREEGSASVYESENTITYDPNATTQGAVEEADAADTTAD
jgi:hypothetical protein